jgi:hypothetical protein
VEFELALCRGADDGGEVGKQFLVHGTYSKNFVIPA